MKNKITGIRGLNPELWQRFRLQAIAKHSEFGEQRSKNSYVAKELNAVLEEYLDNKIRGTHRDENITIIKNKLRQDKRQGRHITKKDVDVAIASTGISSERTAQNYIWYLENTGFFKEIDLKVKVNSIVKYEVKNLNNEEEEKKLAEDILQSFKKKKEEMMYQ